MSTVNLIRMLLIFCFSNAIAQNNFTGFITMNTVPTKNIKWNEKLIGGKYSYQFNSGYMFGADIFYESKKIIYSDEYYYNNLNDFNKLNSVLTLSYLKNLKYKYHIRLEPFIANEEILKFSALYILSEFKVDINLKQNSILTIGVGNSSVFGKPTVIPVLSYYYKYNDKLNLLIGFPTSKFSFSNNSRNIFTIKNDFNGSFYSLNSDNNSNLNTSVKASFSQMSTSLEYERNMDSNWFLNFKLGYDSNKKYQLLDYNYKTTYNFDIKDGFNLGLTIKYKY